MSDEQVEQIKQDVKALQEASADAAMQIAHLTEQVLALQAGTTVSDEQIENLHTALEEVTSTLVKAVEDSQAALDAQASQEVSLQEGGEGPEVRGS